MLELHLWPCVCALACMRVITCVYSHMYTCTHMYKCSLSHMHACSQTQRSHAQGAKRTASKHHYTSRTTRASHRIVAHVRRTALAVVALGLVVEGHPSTHAASPHVALPLASVILGEINVWAAQRVHQDVWKSLSKVVVQKLMPLIYSLSVPIHEHAFRLRLLHSVIK